MTDSNQLNSLTDLLDMASSRRFLEAPPPNDLGLAENISFPFLGLVGQEEMRLALLLSLINPNVGGVLLIGPRGTGKTTAARSLSDLMPVVDRSLCTYGCLPQDIEVGGMDAVCPDCARKYAEGEPLTFVEPVRLIELPLNAELDDVVGGVDERAAVHNRMRIRRGILARADMNLLYVDEVNLLDDDIVDAILDAAAQGSYTVNRGPVAATYRSRFVLIGSMNPEEGRLRPQILDRFGLRVMVRGLADSKDRLEAYRRSIAFRSNPGQVVREFADHTASVRSEIMETKAGLSKVSLSKNAEKFGLDLIQELELESLRAEITLFEAARAHAIADGRFKATIRDVKVVALMALRLRRSKFIEDYFETQSKENEELEHIVNSLSGKSTSNSKPKKKPTNH